MSNKNPYFLPMILLAVINPAAAQHYDRPTTAPPATLQNNRPKHEKESNTRTIEGTVQDASDNPLGDAIVQLKDTKTSKIVDFTTKDDGKFAFHDLAMDITYELVAKHGGQATPAKKVSVYDTRKDVVLNFQLTAAKQ